MLSNLPSRIYNYINDMSYTKDNIGRSDDIVINFENKYVLKISKNISQLTREKDIANWLEGKIPSSKTICFEVVNEYAYYLRTCINGYSLISERFINNPNRLIKAIKNVKEVLDSLNNFECPFKSLESTGDTFIHGDLCLPNIYVDEEDNFIGFIDLSGAGKGDSWQDIAWLIWSFEYNLNTKAYTNKLLKELKINFNENKYNQYIDI